MSKKSRAASSAARAGATAARSTARTARDHPRAAAEGVGVATLAAVVLTGVVLVKIVRSRRVRRVATSSAERGAFGPAVAVATRAAHRAQDTPA